MRNLNATAKYVRDERCSRFDMEPKSLQRRIEIWGNLLHLEQDRVRGIDSGTVWDKEFANGSR
jgi:hypothetical protein